MLVHHSHLLVFLLLIVVSNSRLFCTYIRASELPLKRVYSLFATSRMLLSNLIRLVRVGERLLMVLSASMLFELLMRRLGLNSTCSSFSLKWFNFSMALKVACRLWWRRLLLIFVVVDKSQWFSDWVCQELCCILSSFQDWCHWFLLNFLSLLSQCILWLIFLFFRIWNFLILEIFRRFITFSLASD